MSSRGAVYKKYDGRCAYCGKAIHKQMMQVDHIHPKSGYIQTDEHGNKLNPNRLENLNPACRSCNGYKGAYSVEEFRRYLKQMFHTKNEYLFKSKMKMQCAINFEVLVMKEWDGQFYFEKVTHNKNQL